MISYDFILFYGVNCLDEIVDLVFFILHIYMLQKKHKAVYIIHVSTLYLQYLDISDIYVYIILNLI